MALYPVVELCLASELPLLLKESLLCGRTTARGRSRARELRAQGRTYLEIAGELGVSKSSVYLWVRDLPRTGRLSYEESRRRNDEGRKRYWAAERVRRRMDRQAISAAAETRIR